MTQASIQNKRLGIIGFGQVGQAMAGVLADGFEVTVFDLDQERCAGHPLMREGRLHRAGSAAELAGAVDMVLFCLPTPSASHAVAEDIAGAVRPGLVVVETSTVAAEDIFQLDAVLSPRGARVIDAAVIGGIHSLSQGEAVFLVGASAHDAQCIAPVLERLAAEIFHLGRLGGGMRAKLVANAVSHAVYVVLAEAAAVAAAQDIPMDVLYRLLARKSGLMRPLTHRIGERLFGRDFEGGMSTANARKDSRLFLDTAHRLDVPVFATQAAHSVYEIAMREGLAAEDYAIVATLWEHWTGVRFAIGEQA